MGQPPQSRRARLRAEASDEIKTIALKHMAAGGAAALSLRAIAREMGMTAGAIYSYYDTRDALITALITDIYSSLADILERAQSEVPSDDPAAGILAHAQAYREWAIANPQEFQLVYGDPVPGYQKPEGGAAAEAEHRVCAQLAQLMSAAWPHAADAHSGGDHQWSDFAPELVAIVRESDPDQPPAAIALALRVWGRMHGLLCLEVYGHLRTQTLEPAKLYRAEMLDLTRSLGLAPPRS